MCLFYLTVFLHYVMEIEINAFCFCFCIARVTNIFSASFIYVCVSYSKFVFLGKMFRVLWKQLVYWYRRKVCGFCFHTFLKNVYCTKMVIAFICESSSATILFYPLPLI